VKKNTLELTPKQIVKELDQYIIGQNDAKRAVAIALRNRWRRRNVDIDMRDEIIPNNILMIGSTGVGKTEIARRLARLSGAPFVKVEASKYTEVGYVGRDVEGIIRDLVEVAVSNVRSEFTSEVEEIAENNVEERLLDLLLPPAPPKSKPVKKHTALDDILSSAMDMMKTDSDEKSEAEPESEPEPQPEEIIESAPTDDGVARASRTREKFRAKLKAGLLEDYEVEIKTSDRSGGGLMQVFGPMGIEEMGINLQEMIGPMMPNKKKKRKVSVGEARNLLLGEEVDRLLDMDAVITEAMRRTEEMGIVFIDEVDKIVGADEGGNGPDVSREGVQRDILPIVEGTRVTTKYGPIRTEHILFIAAGAFHVSRPADMIPELQGRFPIRVELDNLGKKEFYRILTEPKNAIIKQYKALFATENVELEFDKAALKEIASLAEEINETMENIGARRLQTVMTTILEEELFKVPSRTIKNIVVTKERVKNTLQDLFEDEDLSRYIL